MPAITLGLAEVEERLRALRRRLNAVTAQHSAYVALSAVFIVITAVIVAGLRASAPVFRVVAWGGGLLALIVVSACVAAARRNWLDIARTAYLVDARGELTDRLATLIDLRVRPRPSRLAPILVAQVLALGPRWQAARIAPRRIPRSIFSPIAAFLLLAGALFIERHTPPPPPAAAATPRTFAATDAAALPMVQPNAKGGVPEHGGVQEGLQPSTTLPPSANSPGGQGNERAGEEPSSDTGFSSQEARSGLSLTDRLQRKIQQAFNGDAPDQPAQVASRAGNASGQEGKDSPGAGKHGPQKERGDNQANPPSSEQTNNAAQQRAAGSKSQNPDPQKHAGTDAPQNFSGSAPAAGEGSNPEGLMDPNAPGAVAESEAKRFKLTITSFLHPVQPQPSNRAPREGSRAGALAPAALSTDLALNERQIADDALRKAEIPPEYEDLVRRVYSTRAEP